MTVGRVWWEAPTVQCVCEVLPILKGKGGKSTDLKSFWLSLSWVILVFPDLLVMAIALFSEGSENGWKEECIPCIGYLHLCQHCVLGNCNASLGSSMDLMLFSEQEKQCNKCTHFLIEVYFLHEVLARSLVIVSKTASCCVQHLCVPPVWQQSWTVWRDHARPGMFLCGRHLHPWISPVSCRVMPGTVLLHFSSSLCLGLKLVQVC